MAPGWELQSCPTAETDCLFVPGRDSTTTSRSCRLKHRPDFPCGRPGTALEIARNHCPECPKKQVKGKWLRGPPSRTRQSSLGQNLMPAARWAHKFQHLPIRREELGSNDDC